MVSKPKASTDVERGRYVVSIAGCNDCHTPGYPAAGGKIPQSKWLTGDILGWRGPWGTTYPPNQEPKQPYIQFPAPPK